MEVWDEKSKTFETSIVNGIGNSTDSRDSDGGSLPDL